MHFKITQEKILTDKHGQKGFNKISKKQPCRTHSNSVKSSNSEK